MSDFHTHRRPIGEQCPACVDGWIQDAPDVDGFYCSCADGEARKRADALMIGKILAELLVGADVDPTPTPSESFELDGPPRGVCASCGVLYYDESEQRFHASGRCVRRSTLT